MSQPDLRCYAPATERNREPILTILKSVLPANGTVLEIASGTGQHAVFFAPRLTPRHWLPSDPNPSARNSITSWIAAEDIETLYPPLDINVTQQDWERQIIDWQSHHPKQAPAIAAIVNINMIHISPWAASEGLFTGAENLLSPNGVLYLYGPFKRNGQHTAPSNEAFDASLRSQNSQWGVRDLESVTELAHQHHFRLADVFPMPANNFSLVFQYEGSRS
ncbi:DUF938 domain-containing protein [Oscillatoria sp. CS-180]|uniref:DUF938 domain-containing protein n=1 Tax=Oscillatoria sp. CS-180 TaxID=3021720 RepID=UPI00232ECECD|nr:DUF938 domain-containing protein [Oscillatoria sp. CS-180]MDB9529191.1 DUF938 domain-containing protein [Oscillatoria sp. CS-180]